MSQDFLLGQLRLILVGVLAYASGRGWILADTYGVLMQISTPFGAVAGPWIWSIYCNIGKKLVHTNVVVLDPVITMEDKDKMRGTLITKDGPVTGVIKVVIVGFMLTIFLVAPSHAQAQKQIFQQIDAKVAAALAQIDAKAKAVTAPLTGTATSSTASNGLTNFFTKMQSALDQFNKGVESIEKTAIDKAIGDVNIALLDASNHNDQISLPCWQSNLALLQGLPIEWPTPPEQPIGIATGIQLQRDLLNSITGSQATSLKVACAALWGDQAAIVTQVGALLGVKIALGGL
jgi:hypothetical protein